MINGAHVVIYIKESESDRAFFRDILKFPSVDTGQGWLIFALAATRSPRSMIPRRTTSTSSS